MISCASPHGERGAITEIYPTPDNLSEDLPERARHYLNQARETLHSASASVVVSASAVDAMLKELKYTKGSLYSRIEKAAADHLITEGMAKWAHQVRLDANDERHADENAELPDVEDARRSLEFAVALGEFLFVLPARITRGLTESAPASKT
jgi:hypothetical protein